MESRENKEFAIKEIELLVKKLTLDRDTFQELNMGLSVAIAHLMSTIKKLETRDS